MSKYLRNLVLIVLFLAPCLSFGMEPDTIKIQTRDEQELEIERHVAQTSVMLKGMIEDIKEEAAIIPATITGQQFDLLLPAMLQLAQLHTTLPQASEEELAPQLQQIVTDLKSDGQSLNNQQLIEFITGANFLNVPLVEPALEALARRILKKDELLQLVALEDKLKDLWHMHPAMGMLSLQHLKVDGVIVSMDGNNLISWSWYEGTIKIWDKNNPQAEPIYLQHFMVRGVIKSSDGNNLISWGGGSIKIWDTNNLAAKPITLEHPWVQKVDGVIVSMDGKNLISWSWLEDTIKIWDKALYNPIPELIQLLLTVYFVSKGQAFELIIEKLEEFKATFNTLSPITQTFLEMQAPDFVAALKAA